MLLFFFVSHSYFSDGWPEKVTILRLRSAQENLVTLKTSIYVRFIRFLSVRPSAYSVVAHPPFSSYGQKKEAFRLVKQFSVTCFVPGSI